MIAPNAFPIRNVFPSVQNIKSISTMWSVGILFCSKVGGFLAMDEYHVQDMDVINAIVNHTTGRPNMSRLEKIIFIADYIEPGRKQAPNLKEIRKLAFMDLDQALLKILKDTLDYLKDAGGEIDPMTRRT